MTTTILNSTNFTVYISPYRDKKLDIFRIALSVLLAFLSLIMLIGDNFSLFAFIDVMPYVLLIVAMNVFWKKILLWSIKHQISGLKKKGRLPYSEASVMEFFDDRFTESTHSSKAENLYDTVERVCIWKNKYIYIHVNTIGAYIIPMSAFKDTDQSNDFITFIEERCCKAEFFS